VINIAGIFNYLLRKFCGGNLINNINFKNVHLQTYEKYIILDKTYSKQFLTGDRECVTNLDYQSKIIIFELRLITFKRTFGARTYL